MQTSPEIAFFLWLNATPQTPLWVLGFARFSSGVLCWLAPVVALVWGLRSPAGRAACLRIVAGMALAWWVAHELRGLLDVPRPAALGLGTQWVSHGIGKGFPSMHAAGALAFAHGISLARWSRVWRALAWATAAAVCWSRLSLGLHFPMDVLCGGLIGMACAWSAFALASAWRQRRALRPGVAGSEI